MNDLLSPSRRRFLQSLGLGTAALAWKPGLALAGQAGAATELGAVDGIAPRSMLQNYLRGLATAALDRRAVAYDALKTPQDIAAYQQRLRAFFIRQLGGFPDRTPLNARVTGRLDGDGYRIEKVIYESLPGYAVTANLYLPLTPPPYPGVLFSCGHSANGKASEVYQLACALMARNGLAVLNYDPIGQGERYHYLDAAGKPVYGATQEHQLLGLRCRLAGIDLARFFIWDGMRGIDYLQSRPEIMADRIGATGNSGGGTQTSYLMALDDRISCAAPSCYLTGFRALLATIGPQDFEQNIYGQIEGGLDHADYVLLRAPKPTLMCVATQDFFDINGAWDVFREAKRIYTRLGFAERVDLVETDEKHGFSIRLREGATRWMRRWLLKIDEPVWESAIKLPAEKDLLCTPEGQVLRVAGAVSLFDILAARDQGFQPRNPDANAIRRVAGIRPLAALPHVRVERKGTSNWHGRTAENVILRYETGLWMPAFDFSAAAGNRSTEATLYFPDDGKKGGVEQGGLATLLASGGRVLTVDLPGLGETGPAAPTGFSALVGGDTKQGQLAFLLDRNLVALRAEAVLICARYLGTGGGIRVVCGQQAALGVLHAAVLEPALFASLAVPTPVSWSETVRRPETRMTFADMVPNALTTYDVPDLLRLIPRGKLRT